MESHDPNVNPTIALRRIHRWRMVLSGLAILIAGITLGVAGTLLVVKPGVSRPPDIDHAVGMTVMRFSRELNLTDEQVDRIRAILRDHFEQLEELRRAARPQIEQVLEDMKSQVSEVLTDEQQTEWQRLIERLEREFRRGMRRGPGGPGGPGRRGDGPRSGRGDGPRGPDRFGPDGERRPWGPGRGGPDPNNERWMRKTRPDANEPAPRPTDVGSTPSEPNDSP
jgi:hypothetical protein